MRNCGSGFGDLQARLPRETLGQRRYRAGQAKIVEGLGAQLARDPADVLEPQLHDLLDGFELRPRAVGHAARDVLQLEQRRGQRLPDLVVQVLRHAQPLALLCVEHAPAGRAPFVLQAFEHVVERACHIGHLGLARVDRNPLPRPARVEAPRQCRHPLERAENAPQHLHRPVS